MHTSTMQVHGHIASRQSVVQKFDIQLRKLGTRFGGQELNLEFLKQSCDYLLKVPQKFMCDFGA